MQRNFRVLEPPLRVGVVGAGYFSQFHMQGWSEIEQARLVAICDADLARAQAAAKRYRAPHGFSDAQEMLRRANLEVLDIVTPSPTHASLINMAVEAGVPVICQKPFAQNYAEAVRLVELAEGKGVPLVVHENFRFMPWYRAMRELVESGLLGKLHGVSFRLRPGDGQGPRAYLDRQPYFQKMPRLLIVETAIHFIDTFRYLVGEVAAVYARLRRVNPAIQGEDCAVITFEFFNGAIGVFDGNRLNDHTAENPRRTMGEMWLEGDKGCLRLDGDGSLWFKPHHGAERQCPLPQGDLHAFGGGAVTALQRHVLRAWTEQTPLENTAREYLKNLVIQEAIYASHASGQRILLDTFLPPEQPVIPTFS